MLVPAVKFVPINLRVEPADQLRVRVALLGDQFKNGFVSEAALLRFFEPVLPIGSSPARSSAVTT